jgi:hypothetical protein
MSDLRPETRALLQAGRGGEEPSQRDYLRNRRALTRRLGAGAMIASVGVAATSGAAAAGGAGAAGGTGVLTHALLSFVVGGAVAGSAVVGAVWMHDADRPVPAVVSTAHLPPPPRAADVRALPQRSEPPGPATVVESPAVENLAPPPSQPEPRAPLPSRPSHASPPVQAPAAPSVAEELQLLRAAEERFHAGAPAQALALLDDHARRFPRGVLAEERRASRILALCQLGQVAVATSEADTFVAQHPSSPFVEKVRHACAR